MLTPDMFTKFLNVSVCLRGGVWTWSESGKRRVSGKGVLTEMKNRCSSEETKGR